MQRAFIITSVVLLSCLGRLLHLLTVFVLIKLPVLLKGVFAKNEKGYRFTEKNYRL